MQTRSGRRDRPRFTSEHSLVTLLVVAIGSVGDIGWQRQTTIALQQVQHGLGRKETQMRVLDRPGPAFQLLVHQLEASNRPALQICWRVFAPIPHGRPARVRPSLLSAHRYAFDQTDALLMTRVSFITSTSCSRNCPNRSAKRLSSNFPFFIYVILFYFDGLRTKLAIVHREDKEHNQCRTNG